MVRPGNVKIKADVLLPPTWTRYKCQCCGTYFIIWCGEDVAWCPICRTEIGEKDRVTK